MSRKQSSIITTVCGSTWKQKMTFLNNIRKNNLQNNGQQPSLITDSLWLQLLRKQKNYNVLLLTLQSLKEWLLNHYLSNVKTKRALLHQLVLKTKLKKQEINKNIVDICVQLLKNNRGNMTNKQPLQSIDNVFNSSKIRTRPSFYIGNQQEIQNIYQQTTNYTQNTPNNQVDQILKFQINIILLQILQSLKYCQFTSFILILKILQKANQNHILLNDQLLFCKNIINHIWPNRCSNKPQSTQQAQIESLIKKINNF